MVTAPFRRILVGRDCSPGASAALSAAAAVAANGVAHMVAHCAQPAPRTEDARDGAADFDVRQRFARETFDKACQAMPQAQQVRVNFEVAQSGDAARAVCEYAQEHGFDLLVLGRHGAYRVLHHRLGHVAATAARKSTVPVLLAL